MSIEALMFQTGRKIPSANKFFIYLFCNVTYMDNTNEKVSISNAY